MKAHTLISFQIPVINASHYSTGATFSSAIQARICQEPAGHGAHLSPTLPLKSSQIYYGDAL